MAEAQSKSESKRKILIAVDGSDHSDRAFHCEYEYRFHFAGPLRDHTDTVRTSTTSEVQYFQFKFMTCIIGIQKERVRNCFESY